MKNQPSANIKKLPFVHNFRTFSCFLTVVNGPEWRCAPDQNTWPTELLQHGTLVSLDPEQLPWQWRVLFFAVTSGVHARIKCPMMELSASHTGTQTAVSNLTSVLKHTLLIAVQFMQVWVTHYKTDAFTLLCFQLYGSFLPRPFQRKHSKVINGKRKQRKCLWKYFYLACLLIRQTFQGRFCLYNNHERNSLAFWLKLYAFASRDCRIQQKSRKRTCLCKWCDTERDRVEILRQL